MRHRIGRYCRVMKFRKFISIMSLITLVVATATWGLSWFAAGSLEMGWRGQRVYTMRIGFDSPGWFARFDVHPLSSSVITGDHKPIFAAAIDPPSERESKRSLVRVDQHNWIVARQAGASAHYVVIIIAAGLTWLACVALGWRRRAGR